MESWTIPAVSEVKRYKTLQRLLALRAFAWDLRTSSAPSVVAPPY